MMFTLAQLDDIRARNPVPDVVASYGGTLRRSAGPCPICGGAKNNARFEATDGGRRWVCAVCQDGGDVIELVMKVEGLDFPRAVERLGGVRNFDPASAAQLAADRERQQAATSREKEIHREAERARLFERWRAGRPHQMLDDYLSLRGIRRRDGLRLRFEPAAPYFNGDILDDLGRRRSRVIWRGPAMLAPIVSAGGRFAGLHITWLDLSKPKGKAEIVDPDTGEALPAKKMRGRKAGGYLDALPGGDPRRCYLGEGIETVASVREVLRDGAVYRVAGDLGNLAGPAVETVAHPTKTTPHGRPQRVPGPEPDLDGEACPLPPECRDLILLRDGDSDPFLTDLAIRRAAARHRLSGRRIVVADPGKGVDFNELARAP